MTSDQQQMHMYAFQQQQQLQAAAVAAQTQQARGIMTNGMPANTNAPTMTNTSVSTNPGTGTPTQAPANPWPTGYISVGIQSNNVPHLLCSRYPKGRWAEDEVTRLKQLTEQCKDQKGEIDWERVIHAWGDTRTR